MAQKVRVGLIGCGGIAMGHIRNLMSIKDAEVAALMDPDDARIATVRQQFPALVNVPTFSDHKELIKNVELDATVICSPHYAHCRQILDSLRAGLHVLTEKPMVCSVKDAHSVMKEEKKAGKLVAASYQRHCQGPFQFVRKALQREEAGKVKFISAFQAQSWLHFTRGTWRQVKELSCGGQLNDSGSHLIDVVLWLTGLEPQEVFAHLDNCGTEVDVDSAVCVKFRGGAMATFAVVGSAPVPWWEDLTIVCERWSFFMRQGELRVTTGLDGETHRVEGFMYGSPSCDHNFVDAILGRAEVLAPSICGLRTIELTEAAWKSAETGKPARV